MGTGRLEAFSDGVMAVAITLLVLQISVPGDLHGHTLAHALLADWSHYAAYVVSFLTIGIIWINHHAAISRLREADHAILMLNLLLLMCVAILPFATALVAAYRHAELAAALYALSFLLMGATFVLLNHHILMRKHDLLVDEPSLAERRRILLAAAIGTVPYAAGVALAFVSPYLTFAICGAVAVYYALPLASRG